ncbi:F-box/kelch-repeat protein At1g23390-like [Papaver somniferum]|uniref:F-box/kelch-repeat protein At1g23390-like n=1 Tax=Papaver somniferum TaxID=3469 RepID=UPI000E70326E|nr:F-box/kelch-repeat protein At1g23390-like [Papaver somniferum]XP_026460031.1 F-box/kelch-repeat protein At1g23390-like [Papaver somniferum]
MVTESRYPETKDQETGEETPIHGDVLDKIVSHIPTIHLVPSFYVSKSWQRAAFSCVRHPSRTKPWIMIYAQSRRSLSLTTTQAYDPSANVWIEITGPSTMTCTSPLRSSNSDTLYMLTPSKFSFSADPLHVKWLDIVGPRVWRADPIVAIVGSCIVVAGGAYDFEDDCLTVEIYDTACPGWFTCPPIPVILKDSAATTWLSVAVSGHKMYLLEKNSGTFCSFNTNTKRWSGTSGSCVLRPDPSIYFSIIGFAGHRLILVGLMGDAENAESLRIWEVNCDSFYCEEIGKMPLEMFGMLKNVNTMPLSIDISVAENFIYIYHASEPRDIFLCELNVGICQWGSIRCSFLNDRVLMDRIVFTSSKVSLDDLRKAFWLETRNFKVESA